MSCKGPWQKIVNWLRGRSCVAEGQVDGAPRCVRCRSPLDKNSKCPRGHSQTAQSTLQQLFASTALGPALNGLTTTLRQLAQVPAEQRMAAAGQAQEILQAATALVRARPTSTVLGMAQMLAEYGLSTGQQLRDRTTQRRAIILLTDIVSAGGPPMPPGIPLSLALGTFAGAFVNPGKDLVYRADLHTSAVGVLLRNATTKPADLQHIPHWMAAARAVYEELGDVAGQVRTLEYEGQAQERLGQATAALQTSHDTVRRLGPGPDYRRLASALGTLRERLQAQDQATRVLDEAQLGAPPPPAPPHLAALAVLQDYYQGRAMLQDDVSRDYNETNAAAPLRRAASCQQVFSPEVTATLQSWGVRVPSYAQMRLDLADALATMGRDDALAYRDEITEAMALCEQVRADPAAAPTLHEAAQARIVALFPAYKKAQFWLRGAKTGPASMENDPAWQARAKDLLRGDPPPATPLTWPGPVEDNAL